MYLYTHSHFTILDSEEENDDNMDGDEDSKISDI